MKLKKLQTYQPVLFNKANETHFDILNPKWAGIQLTYHPQLNAAEVTLPGHDSVYIFSTNLAYVKPLDKPAKPAQKSK